MSSLPFTSSLSRRDIDTQNKKVENIKGIKASNMEIKLTQFANDTMLFCADTVSVQNALALRQIFKKL